MKGQKGNSARRVAEAIKVATCALPAAVTKRGRVAAAPATTSTAAATATAPATTTATATSSAAAVADHLSETGVDLLLGLLEHVDEVTSLLGIWKTMLVSSLHSQVEEKNLLSVVKRVMAVPIRPARAVRPIRWM